MEQFQTLIVQIGGPILIAIGAILLAILWKVFAKYGLELSDAQKAQIKQLVQGLILQVEEWARRRALEGVRVTAAVKESKFRELAEATPELVKLPLAEVLAQRDEELPKVRAALEPTQGPA